MRANSFFLAACAAAIATAQDLATVLAGQESLSTLVELLGQVPNTTKFLASQQGVTLFAPNNDALAAILGSAGIFSIEQVAEDPGLVEQTLRYHLLRGVIRSEDITPIPQLVPSYLNYSGFVLDNEVSGSNVTGGAVVSVNLDEEGNAIVTAGIKRPNSVVVADLEFDNGVIHIIDGLLIIPLSVSATLIAGGFTALAGAATQADLVQPLEALSDVTIFCPNNDAFQAIASGSGDITDAQLKVVQEVEITITDDGAVFVNSARVINADVLIANGVLHVIDEVLNPAKPDVQPNENIPVNPATSVGTVVPFTSGVQPETEIFYELTQTTSFVAAGLVTATPSMANAPGDASVTTSGVVMQTGNAGVRNVELPALAAAVMGAVAFAINM